MPPVAATAITSAKRENSVPYCVTPFGKAVKKVAGNKTMASLNPVASNGS